MTEEGFEPEDLDLQRRLDAAFSQTRPRRGFEDLLWARLDGRSHRSLRNGAARLLNRVPRGAWPALGGLAAILVLFVAILPLLTHGHQGASSDTTGASAGPRIAPESLAPGRAAQGSAVRVPSTAFGLLPTPTLATADRPATQAGSVIPYYGPAVLSVTATAVALPLTLPVFRFAKPSTRQAALMARAYHGQPVATSSQPFREPRVQITASKAAPDGGSPLGDESALAAADAFLAERKLALRWPHLPEIVDQGSLAFVHYVRQFEVDGYGVATQVDQMGAHAGADVAVRPDGKVLLATLPMQLGTQSSAYPSRAPQKVAQGALNVPPGSSVGLTPVPEVQLSRGALVYIAVSADRYGYFEPAYLFTGAFTVGGAQYEKRVLVPALDASQLSK